MKRTRLAGAIAACACVFAATASQATAAPIGTLDASCNGPTGAGFVPSYLNNHAVQTFVAGDTGRLTYIELDQYARAPGGTGGDIAVALLPTVSGVPQDDPLATAIVPNSAITPNNQFQTIGIDFDASSTFYVQQGTTYAIRLINPDTVQNSWFIYDSTCTGAAFTHNGASYVSWGPFSTGQDHRYRVYLSPPRNDSFANAEVLPDASDGAGGNTGGATREGSEPDHLTTGLDAGNWQGDHTVWYRWTAHGSGSTRINTCDALIDSILGVYIGEAIDALARIGDNNNDASCPAGTWGSSLTFDAVAGEEYRIAVGDAGGARELPFAIEVAGPPNEPPAISGLKPKAGKVVRAARVPIKATILDAVDELGKPAITVKVDGQKLSFAYNASTGALSLRSKKLKPGRHKVQIEATDPDGATAKASTRFKYQPRS